MTRPRPASPRRLTALLAALLLGSAALTGCGTGLNSAGDKGYVDGSGVITVLPAAQRVAPGPISGRTLEGNPVSLAQYAGKVVVINVWGAWCPPCRAEAAQLADAARRLAKDGVVFLGINTRDSSPENGLSFQRERNVPYPSIYDPSGENLLAFHGTLSPNAIPSTVVIDAQGRVAASILGELTRATTLVELVHDVVKGTQR